MNKPLMILVLVWSVAVAAAGPSVPVELVGRWAAAGQDCKARGARVLVIGDAGVERGDLHGHVVGGPAPANPVIEVHYRSPAGGATARSVRIYRLSADRETLLELSGTRLVATWTLCSR